MTEQPPLGPDPAFDSLRKADPAARAGADQTDEANIRADIRSRLAQQAEPQRRRPWLTVAAAAAAAVIIGGGGYWVGSAASGSPAPVAAESTSPATEGAGSAEIMAVPDSGAAAAPSADAAAGGQPLAAPGISESAAGADKRSTQSALWSGRTQFTQEGLSAEVPVDAEVSAINPAAPDPAVLAAIGAVIGAQGEPRDTSSGDWTSWSIGSEDGNGPNGYLDGTGNLSLNNPAAWQAWDACAAVGTPEPAIDPPVAADPAESPAVDVMPVEPCEPTEPLPPLDQAAADATIVSILTAAGLDPASFTITWTPDAGDGQSWATADPGWLPPADDSADRMGQWTPGSWSFNFIGNTFSSANGTIASLAPAGSYQLISPVQAVERLSDPRFGAPMMVTQPDMGIQVWEPTAPGSFTGGPIPWPVAQMAITGAELRTTAVALTNGVTVLAPTYRLSTADGYAWDVIAVADSGFDFAS